MTRLRSQSLSSSRHSERGYAYLMALFMVLTLIIASQVAMQSISDGRAPPARGRNDLARPAVCSRDSPLLPQNRALSARISTN